jgi:formate dehydrogenase alpha subunit
MKRAKKRLVNSVCPFCGVGCGIVLEVEKGRVVRVLPRKDAPANKGLICVKGTNVHKAVHSPERLTHPLKRTKDGEWTLISWKEALDTVANEFKRIKKTYGPNAIGVVGSTKTTNEECYLTQKFARVAIGTNNIDNSTRLCHAPTVYGLGVVLGKSAMTNSFDDLEQSSCILIVGDNPAVSHPVTFQRVLKCRKSGGKIIVVDVRKSETAEQADVFIRVNPGTDLLLIAGMMKIILDMSLDDKDFIKRRTRGYEDFLEHLEKISMSKIERLSGVGLKKIKRIARIYGRAKSAAILFGMGVTQHSSGMETVQALADLALMTGNFGRPGTGINPLRGCNNVQGACDMGALPDVYPGYAKIEEKTAEKFKAHWDVKILPLDRGLTLAEMIDAIPERIQALYIIGQDPLVSGPNVNIAERNLENLEFLVVQDIFMTEVAKHAHMILPAASFAEKDGTVTNSERRIQMLNHAVAPPGQARTDLMIINDIASRMGYSKHFSKRTPKQVFEEVRRCVPIYGCATWSQIKKTTVQWPCDPESPRGTKILYTKEFASLGNHGTFYPLSFVRATKDDKSYPFALISHRLLRYYNTGSMSRQMFKAAPKADWAELNPSDARDLRIKEGDRIRIESRHGHVNTHAKVSDRMSKGTVALPGHFPNVRVNRLVGNDVDKIANIPAFKDCRVRIEKVKK